MSEFRIETDGLGEVRVPADKLWGAQTQRSLEYFSIGTDLMPREMITAYAILKKAAADANHAGKRLDDKAHELIVKVCDEILAGRASRHVSAACVDDGERHAIQHERERGDLEPREPARRHGARQQKAGASQRSRQHVAIVERHLSVGDVHRRRDRRETPAGAGGDGAPRRHRRQGRRLGRHHQDRPHPHAGCDAAHARPGMVRLCRHARRRSGTARGGAAGRLSARARRHRGRHRDQRRAGFCRSSRRGNRQAHRPALRHRAEQIHGAGRP